MAVADWEEIYESYSASERATELARLKKAQGELMAGSAGSKSYQRDLRELRDKLQAMIRVMKKAGGQSYEYRGVADLSEP